jgi:hypothetical protein
MLRRPVVGVVPDLAVLVRLDLIPLHHPLDGGFSVDNVIIGGEGDIFHPDIGVFSRLRPLWDIAKTKLNFYGALQRKSAHS